ncbi:uncharacterized protein DNG_03423 [Cephalotrichum gorgonifer]|uniref:14-3-3 domain-containing protein n=1 Tax=Cephalotrichum gorgonifer TaxID=2041049 RepID=A0AAE8SU94_9PEZI|nr:uncharacterized protein DNG_03423 [Cephalotrichum gorgonifer]
MASSEVDQKFLGKLAKMVEQNNPLLSSILFKILGLSLNLAEQLVTAKKQRRQRTEQTPEFLKLVLHIIWLSREGLKLLDQYVIPSVGHEVELKVLAYKLRASFYHIFVLFHNSPRVSDLAISTPDVLAGVATSLSAVPRLDKGKGVARDDDLESLNSSIQPTHPMEGGPVGPPPGFGLESPASFLIPATDYLPVAHQAFKEAISLSEELLWGSHSLRLSVKTEYAAFLFECAHDPEASRSVAKKTIAEVYEAQEGMDDDMFADACELVTVLGRMMKRGLGSGNTPSNRQTPTPAVPPPGMENPI